MLFIDVYELAQLFEAELVQQVLNIAVIDLL